MWPGKVLPTQPQSLIMYVASATNTFLPSEDTSSMSTETSSLSPVSNLQEMGKPIVETAKGSMMGSLNSTLQSTVYMSEQDESQMVFQRNTESQRKIEEKVTTSKRRSHNHGSGKDKLTPTSSSSWSLAFYGAIRGEKKGKGQNSPVDRGYSSPLTKLQPQFYCKTSLGYLKILRGLVQRLQVRSPKGLDLQSVADCTDQSQVLQVREPRRLTLS